ncbi:MAG: GGDEF domain-containing protein [Actinobacteria bacterium]|nr:GGDEF domain-containing protein [Actinomycetota bacterium]MBI3687846.1 GGDEF domain-containing protein [Actinomycetota bacterium]
MTRQAHEAAGATTPTRPAGLSHFAVGSALLAAATAICAVLPLADPAAAAVTVPLLGCAALLVIAAVFLGLAHSQIWRDMNESRQTSQISLTEKHALAEELRTERDFTSAILDTAGALVVVCDRTGRIKRFNDASEKLTGFSEAGLVGRPMWAALLEPADGQVMKSALEALDGGKLRVRSDALQRAEVTLRDRAGKPHRVAFTITVMLNDIGEVAYFVATGIDVTEQRRNHEHLVQLATTDPLTGLVNRVTFNATLGMALNPTLGGRGAALLFCDLDGFKVVNDTHGHQVGDELLIAVGERLRACVRHLDVTARLGGDEFVVLCPKLDEISAYRLADRIRRAVAEPYSLSVGTVAVGISVGVAVARAGDDPEIVLAEADAEMYRVKQRAKLSRWTPPSSVEAPHI